ncbi:hypothetical protein BD410DRAFT_762087 [Rickenella mellea]|uniref:Mitochondrial carrier n=1 Tax=Rickenella mellea TaxID=50990 RepID=A0A4Y7QI37_9AGAM|nr:hypothetical protein BD410DRAFT_762087 [Rickenella mellea]
MSAGTDGRSEQGSSFKAAAARTVSRGLALYFSRPVRLFRPSKVSGWTSLRGAANRDGVSLSPQYISTLVKQHGIFVIPRHFIPPLIINATLGTILWASYSQASSLLDRWNWHFSVKSAACGGVAGGTQALFAAPAENLRLIMEGRSHSGWSHAWKTVFLGADHAVPKTDITRQDLRRWRSWIREFGDMAGRGWDGWGWGCGKDVCGFAVFFSIFEVTRRSSSWAARTVAELVDGLPPPGQNTVMATYLPRIVHGTWLVSGGVAAGLSYELVGRPWDVARRIVYLQRAHYSTTSSKYSPTILQCISNHVRTEGLTSFFRRSSLTFDAETIYRAAPTRTQTAIRTLARVGPWGIAFLVWEALGPGIAGEVG